MSEDIDGRNLHLLDADDLGRSVVFILHRRFFRTKEQRIADREEFEQKFAARLARMAQDSSLFQMDDFIQHGNTSTLLHCIAVSYFSCLLARKFRLSCSEKELLRGALLHDYFLYDWHDRDKSHSWHGFTHPGKALRNARRDFRLSLREQDIIEKHMFPLTPALPKYRETVLVCLVDKWCSTYEVFCRNPYEDLRMRFLQNRVLVQRACTAQRVSSNI